MYIKQLFLTPVGNLLVALTLLPYMLPDVRTKPNSDNIIYFTKVLGSNEYIAKFLTIICNVLPVYTFYIQGCTNVTEVAAKNSNLAPYTLVLDHKEAVQAFLVADRQVITEVGLEDIPFVLMSSFLCLIYAILVDVQTFMLLWRCLR